MKRFLCLMCVFALLVCTAPLMACNGVQACAVQAVAAPVQYVNPVVQFQVMQPVVQSYVPVQAVQTYQPVAVQSVQTYQQPVAIQSVQSYSVAQPVIVSQKVNRQAVMVRGPKKTVTKQKF